MTPAIDLLKKLNIDFVIHQYEHDPQNTQFGQEAVIQLSPKLNIIKEQIFKTLVICVNDNARELAVCVLPVDLYLDLKKTAKILKCKKVELADLNLAQKTTGYLIGGISPIGQKRQLTTLIDSSAMQFKTIFVSGGRRGVEVEISPKDLASISQAQFTEITT